MLTILIDTVMIIAFNYLIIVINKNLNNAIVECMNFYILRYENQTLLLSPQYPLLGHVQKMDIKHSVSCSLL